MTIALVLLAPVTVLLLVVAPGAAPPDGGVLTVDDRTALGDPGPDRGPDPPVPAVLPASPEAVARAYLAAAHGGAPGSAGTTRRDAAGYAIPGGAGFPVLDPPGPGERRIAVVEALEPAGSDPVRGRVAFVAGIRTTTAAVGAPPRTERWRTRVVLHRGPAGRWLVAADTPITPDTPDVGD